MTTAANVRRNDSSRFYTADGVPVFEVPKKRGDGMKKPNITDFLENYPNWKVSVTTVIKDVLRKPALERWLTEQSVLAVLSSPRKPGEELDAFVHRVLVEEEVQEEQARKAAQLGTDIHKAVEDALNDQPYPEQFKVYVDPVLQFLKALGRKVWSEKVLVGELYAGRSDYLGEDTEWLTLVDLKTTTKLPEKQAWPEAKMQMAAYAKTLGNSGKKGIRTCGLYISTTTPGQVMPFIEHNWERDYLAFRHLLEVWLYMNGVV